MKGRYSSSGVPALWWRDGRPRWSPSASIRALGFKSKDLKYENGDWLPLDLARAEAQKLNAQVQRVRMGIEETDSEVEPEEPAGPASGYVYFLWVEAYVKIGFSIDPFARAQHLRTGLPGRIRRMAAVEGSTIDERRLHRRYEQYRTKGEWFTNAPGLEEEILLFVKEGRITIVGGKNRQVPVLRRVS